MWLAALLMVLVALPAGAQSPLPTPGDCPAIIGELHQQPPAYGDGRRAEYEWNSYLANCETRPGSEFSMEEITAISKVIYPKVWK